MVRILDAGSSVLFQCTVLLVSTYFNVYDVGVPAGGRASASTDPPPPGSPAANRHTAAPLQSRPGEEELC